MNVDALIACNLNVDVFTYSLILIYFQLLLSSTVAFIELKNMGIY